MKTFFYVSILFNIVLLTVLFVCVYKHKDVKDHLDFSKYASENAKIKDTNNSDSIKLIFIGNSITANWINLRSSFFFENKFANRGVGGQTSSQILLRFQQDVVDLGIKKVVLNAGINDIGEGDGFYNQQQTLRNIESMIAIAKQNDIQLILSSVLPATDIYVNRFEKIADVQQKIEQLNKEILNLAFQYDLVYIDYNTKLSNQDGTFKESYTFDGVHPNEGGYEIMETLVLQNINN